MIEIVLAITKVIKNKFNDNYKMLELLSWITHKKIHYTFFKTCVILNCENEDAIRK